jgi:hypothetical protein
MALLNSTTGALLCSMMEPQAIPSTDAQRLKGCWFAIPLVVPSHIEGVITILLLMKSGAAWAKGKHYLLGQFQLNAAQLHASLHNFPSTTL